MDLVMVAGRFDSPARRRVNPLSGIVNNAISFGMFFSEAGPAGREQMARSRKTTRIATGARGWRSHGQIVKMLWRVSG
jgi:hypothetical protein